ncbi:MAG: hypothetical protein WAT46_00325 [Saprospiraceae bacterium]
MAELKGNTSDFTTDRIAQLLEENKDVKTVKFFLNVIKTTLALHQKTKAPTKEVLIVKIEVKLSPEIKVFLGKPELLQCIRLKTSLFILSKSSLSNAPFRPDYCNGTFLYLHCIL